MDSLLRSSGFSVARIEVETAAVEVNSGGKVVEIAEASRGGFDPLDFPIESFTDRVYPGGIVAISRGLSGAIPPVRSRRWDCIPEGCQR